MTRTTKTSYQELLEHLLVAVNLDGLKLNEAAAKTEFVITLPVL